MIIKSLAAQENYQSSFGDSSDAKPPSPLSIDQLGIRESTHVFPRQRLHFPPFLLCIG